MYLHDSCELLGKLRLAFEQGDADATRTAAHALKSNSANVGAKQLASLSKELEEAGRRKSMENARLLLEEIKREHGRVVAALRSEVKGVPNARS
jgi:HPt (histidine-containing phosphotransfer) domain-containing protein